MSRTIHKFNFRALILWVSMMSMLIMPIAPALAQFDSGFAGRWTMDWQGNGVGTLTLTQSGKSVSGSFSTKLTSGKVFGTVNNGATRQFLWLFQSHNKSRFQFLHPIYS